MSPGAALESPVFRFYALLILGLLLLAGLVLVTLRWGLHRNVDHAWKAYRGWLIMAPLLLGVLFLGRLATIVCFTFLALVAFKEFARATGLYNDWFMSGTVSVGIAAVGVVAMIPDPRMSLPGWYGMFMALPVYAIAAVLVIPILRNRAKGQLQAVALAIVGFTYFGWMFGHVGFLTNARLAYAYLFYLLLAVELNDVSAYAFGKLFGRHPLRSNISPAKTWEGAIGALLVSLALP
jgi:phosphatidate cytidylyltransferase